MLRENLIDFLKELLYSTKKALNNRIVPFVIVAFVLFGILIVRVFNLQIVNGEEYVNSYIMKAEKTISTTGTRGNIYDRNNKLIAYSELAYSVVIEDCGYYESRSIKHSTMNDIISRMVEIIEKNGDTVDYDFGIDCDENGNYYYTLEGNSLLRFLRDIYGHKAISELSEEERNATAEATAKVLRDKYKITTEADSPDSDENTKVYSDYMASRIFYIRYNLDANSYKRYISFNVASNVGSETMAAILENSDSLTGVSISENTIRKYNYSEYVAHIIGYTGKISQEQLDELKMLDSSYESNDIVGKAGIEQAYETTLSGTKGEQSMLVDSVGRVIEITNEIPAQAGQDVYLTIDVELQEKLYNLLERRLAEIVVSYMTPDDVSIQEDGQVLIPIKDVYFALLNNNLIDKEQINTAQSEASKRVASLYAAQKNNALQAIADDLKSGNIYAAHDDVMKSYLKLVRRVLIDNGIINSEKINTADDLSTLWNNGSITLRQYLEGTINNQWVNIYNLDIDSEYPTTDEVLEAMIATAMELLNTSDDFSNLIYEYLVKNNILSGRDICLVLMEQGAVKYTQSEYLNIVNGGSTFDFLKKKIASLDITPAQLALDPCSGSCVVEDPKTGEILAMVSYPSYDINMFSGTIDSEYYAKLLADKSTPLVNRATQTKIAPGSTFKPLTAIAGLSEGVITPSDYVYCDGLFDSITPNIKCWINPGKHGSVNTESALEHSCNEYFCEIGYRLCFLGSNELNFDYGLSRLKKYSDMLGLSTKTGIQIPETTPRASDYNAVVSAIGQGTSAYTSLNLARYTSTLANSGTVYNSSIVKKISDGEVSDAVEPVVANTVDIDSSIWNVVHRGMERVIEEGVMYQLTKNLPVTIYGKSGTAQEDKTRGDHACYIMFAKDDEGDGEVAVSVMLPYGHSATHAGIMGYYALASYYDTELPSSIIFTTRGTMEITE